MRKLMITGALMGFVIGMTSGLTQGLAWPVIIWRSCWCGVIAGFLFRWFAGVCGSALRNATIARQQAAKAAKAKT